ncbi:hypothetical protein TrST_g4995 [Triparma strigata]|uniref:Cyclic nucleotide-binding domain-containing protein n=1 Tax=Triparma strigata TaxID=1606541 RepID=A0A9W7ALE7_9STRA|nr:hypothetical protein TrST_g4995 [Triparma strigata]
MTNFLHKTPFFVYMSDHELKDFAKCFTVKKVAKGAVIKQSGDMYIVADGEIQMTTMLGPQDGNNVPIVGSPVIMHAGDATTGRSLKRDAGESLPSDPAARGRERSIKIRHQAGQLISTGNLAASGIMSHERAEKHKKKKAKEASIKREHDRQNDGRAPSPTGVDKMGSPSGNNHHTPSKRKNSNFRSLLERKNSQPRSPLPGQPATPLGIQSPKGGSSVESYADESNNNQSSDDRDGSASFRSNASAGRRGSVSLDDPAPDSDERDGRQKRGTGNMSFSGKAKQWVRKKSFALGVAGSPGSPGSPEDSSPRRLSHSSHHDSSAPNSASGNHSLRQSHRFGLNLFGGSGRDKHHAHDSHHGWLSGKMSSRREAETVRGVMKLEAVEDSVILFLDSGRRRRFVKKYPELKDIVETLMHAKIDNFLSQLPFIKIPKKPKKNSPVKVNRAIDAFVEEEGEEEDEDEDGNQENPADSDSDEEDKEHGGLGMLSSVCKYEAFQEGDPIFCEGEVGDKLYIILKGTVAVLKTHDMAVTEEPIRDERTPTNGDATACVGNGSDDDANNQTSGTITPMSSSVGAKSLEKGLDGDDTPSNSTTGTQNTSPNSSQDLPGQITEKVVAPPLKKMPTARNESRRKSLSKSGSQKDSSKRGSVSLNLGKLATGHGKNMFAKMRFGRNADDKSKAVELDEEDILATLKAGNYFGEMAVMVTMPRSSTVVAKEKCLLLTVSKADWAMFLQHHHKTRRAVEQHMKSRLMGLFRNMNIPFFETVHKDRYEELSPGCDVLDLPPGSEVIKQGDRGDTFYVIIHGRVDVAVRAGVGKAADAPTDDWDGELVTGQFFGEIALVMDSARKATVTTSESTVLLVIDKGTFRAFFNDNARALAEVQVRLLGEKAELHSLLSISASLEVFKDFLDAEHSGENVEFWECVTNFEEESKNDKFTAEDLLQQESRRTLPQLLMVEEIWDKYLREAAEHQVNISSKMRQAVQKKIESMKKWSEGQDVIMDGTMTRKVLNLTMDEIRKRAIFHDAKEEIYKLMVRDSYPRFKKQEAYKNFIGSIGLYSTANQEYLSSKMAQLKDRNHTVSGKRGASKAPSGGYRSKFQEKMSSVRHVLSKPKAMADDSIS